MIFWMDADGHSYNQSVGVHHCNEADYEKFYPSVRDQHLLISKLKEENAFYCLDDKDTDGKPLETLLFGKSDIVMHHRLDIIFTPCVPEQLTKANEH